MIDTHCHLSSEFYEDIDEVIKKMEKHIIIISGTCDKDNIEVLEICSKYPNIYGTIGIHPEEVSNISENSFNLIEENLNNPKIVGIGEIGLDYHYTKENKELQKEVFIKQIQLAKKYHKSIVVHSRDAIEDTYEILKEYGKGLKIDIHCFNSSVDMAKKFINLGCRLGVGGVLTFKNSNKIKEVVERIDLKNLLLETDSPFLTPEPFRGKRNEPYNIYYVAQKISEIKNIPLENVLEIMEKNAISQFDLPIDL